ncbi:hypothetical protein [Limnobacter sp.]|uniref:hypothetical protein n=1 Tax=Limnobacter sp. TaxID=2003368 RepID=UPI0035122022
MAAPQAIITALEGDVQVIRDGQPLNIQAGDFLLPGDQVQTGENGRLGLEFPGLEGQKPAAGVMTANGKITLGEQAGVNGPQLVVMEDVECFEFTTEVAENSAAVEGSGMSGLFGAGMLGAGGSSVAGLGALAAGAFLGGSDSGGDAGGASSTSRAGGGSNLGTGEFSSSDSPQSLEEFRDENLTQENLEDSVINPVQEAVQNSADNPQSTPDNVATAGGDVGMAGAENVHDLLVASTGEGTPQATVVDQLVQGAEGTPLGEPLSPVTNPVQEVVNTDMGLDTLISTMQAAGIEGENLVNDGLVSAVVDVADAAATPVTNQVEPLGEVIDQLHPVASEVDAAIDGVLTSLESALGSSPVGEASPGGEPSLADLAEGILGGADTLQNALNGAGGGGGGADMPEGDLIGTVSSGISSGADALADQAGGAGLPTDVPSI